MVKTIKQEIMDQFPELTEQDFSSHESDLYVKNIPGLVKFLKETLGLTSSFFRDQVTKKIWVEIPFMNDLWWDQKYSKKKTP
jgi:hypothetical protein